MSSVFARLGLCALLLLTIKGSVQGFPAEDSSGSNEVDLAQNNANETVRWSNWSGCSLSCGGGKRTRIKLVPECNISTPAADDSKEPADNSTDCVDTESCNVHPCPVDGKWSAWKPWSDCSATCGPTGVRKRHRKCEPAERHGGNDCIGNRQESGSCNRHVTCPIDGIWESWKPWSVCSATCGPTGVRTRYRECKPHLAERYGGKDCGGPNHQTEDCNSQHCPVDGKWSAWKPWSDCSATCGPTGVRTRQRKCEPAERHGGNDCIGNRHESEICNRLVNCPVDGIWESWKPWSVCSATCGPTGVRTRNRECKPPLAERYGGKDCDGPNHHTEGCNRQQCPVDGGWANWSDWSESSATCGSYRVFRTRTCTNPEPKYGGHSCSGPNREWEWRTHRVVHCPIPGGWSRWSSWSSYSVTCGKPVVERTRSCTNPRPQYGGQHCNGKPRDTKVVDTRVPCPIHGGWSEWQARTKCPPSKMLWQLRSCTNPRPQHNGRLCNGTSQRQVPCEPIRVNGTWCQWGAWGRCSRICYTNTKEEQFRTRHRKCECPKPENGGQDCGLPLPDTSPCAVEDVQPCNPPTRAPCRKATTPPGNYGDYYGGDGDEYDNEGGGNVAAEEVTTAGPQYGNYDDYDC